MCCCLSGAVSGMVLHCRGVFFVPAAATLGTSPTTYATYSFVGGIVGVFSLPFVQRRFSRLPIKGTLLTYLGIFSCSVIGLGLAQNMFQTYLFGALQGTVSSFLTFYPIAFLLRNWFDKKRGLENGIATMFAGLFGAIMK